MDEIWVPTAAAQEAFLASGVPLHKLVVVPEPVDTNFFTNQRASGRDDTHLLMNILSEWKLSPHEPDVSSDTFIFLFVGKFEYRKGIHLLLKAFYEEFFSHLTSDKEMGDDVLLCILTSAYHSTNDFYGEVERFLLEEELIQSIPLDFFLSKIVLFTDVPQVQMPVLYSMADVLVGSSK
jgi:glycosyltransferase involved in cell wall biosynthesis